MTSARDRGRIITLSDDDLGTFSETEVGIFFEILSNHRLYDKDRVYLERMHELWFSTDTCIYLMQIVRNRAYKPPGSMKYYFLSLREVSKASMDRMLAVRRDYSIEDEVQGFHAARREARQLIFRWCRDRFSIFQEYASASSIAS